MKIYTNEEIMLKKAKRNKILDKIKLIIILILLSLVLYNITLIIQAILIPEKTPNVLGYKTFSIISGSMSPTIKVGDIVIVKEEKNLKVNDIISFRREGEIITHRIINIAEEKNQKKYITKGDSNNAVDDSYVYYKDIEGKVIKRIPKLGSVMMILQKRIVILLIIFIFVVSYLSDLKRNNKKKIRKQKREILKKEG